MAVVGRPAPDCGGTAMRLAGALIVAIVAAAGCSGSPRTTQAASPAVPERRTGVAATTAESDERGPTSTAAPSTAPGEHADYRAVLDARDAAWHASVESVAPPEPRPGSRALRRTHTGGLLVHVIRHAMALHQTGGTWRYRPRSGLDVQSVTFPDTTTAWLETCVVSDVEILTARGKVLPRGLFGSGTTTAQQTEVMKKEGGTWKLAESMVNGVRDGRTDCPGGDASERVGDDIYSDAAITRAREASEEALLDLLTTKQCCSLGRKGLSRLSDTHTGSLLNDYTFHYTSDRHLDYEADERPTRYFSSSTDCPHYPGTSLPPKPPPHKYSKRLYALFDTYWKQFGDSDPQYGSASAGCLRRYNTAVPHGPVDADSRVVVDSIVMQADAAPAVAYVRTCRRQKLQSKDGPSDFRLDAAVVRATESMRLEDGTWKLANRWDIAIDDDASAHCDEGR
jgi:hypothetical protein